MKRALMLLVCLMIFAAGFSSACAQEQVCENREFLFRNGITWKSTLEEVALAENEESERDEFNGFLMHRVYGVSVSNFEADLAYYFADDRLLMAAYFFDEGALREDQLLYLQEALAYKYGEPVAPDMERLNTVLRAIEDTEYPVSHLINWQLEDGTYIAQFDLEGFEFIFYINQDALLRARGVYNTAGL